MLTHSLISPVLHQPDKVSAETMSGKTADGRTVLSNESEIFKTEAIKDLCSTIFTDIKNLNKARKVVWNDTQGETGASAIKQIFSNIKHNIRAIWIGKKGELKASDQLKTHIKKFEILLKETVIDSDLKKDCEAFYNELKGKRLGGYANTKGELTDLIGGKDTDGSLKKNIETFLRGNINEKGGFFEVNDLVQRFREVSSEGDLKVEKLLKTYEANSDEGKLKTEIKNLFETKWIGELRENKCRDIDVKRDLLIKHIEAFAKGDYGFSSVTRMDCGDYYTDYATDGETTDKVENAEWTAFEQLMEEFKDAFPNGDGTDFKSLLAGVRGKNNTVNRLKALVKDAAKAQKENVKNEKPTSEEVAQKDKFLKNLPLYLNKQS